MTDEEVFRDKLVIALIAVWEHKEGDEDAWASSEAAIEAAFKIANKAVMIRRRNDDPTR